jgi:hypothetical protein
MQYHEQYGLQGDLRQQQFGLVKKLFALKQTGLFQSQDTFCEFVCEVYRVSDLSQKGRKRATSLEFLLQKAKEVFDANGEIYKIYFEKR